MQIVFASRRPRRVTVREIASGDKLSHDLNGRKNTVTIRFDHVGYTVGETVILADLELDIYEGETVVLLGESGCGKTTTLKMINRLIEPTSGEVSVRGRSTRDWDAIELRRGIGYVLQEAGLFPHFTIADNVGIVLRLLNWDADRRTWRVAEMLEMVGLEPARFADTISA